MNTARTTRHTFYAWSNALALAITASFVSAAAADCTPHWDPAIGQPGMFGVSATRVSALTVFDDGSGSGPALYAGGAFNTAGGVTVNHIARWDGESWSALGSGVSGFTSPSVNGLTVFDDGSGPGPALYAGGLFSTAGGESALLIARWDGESWSALGSGIGGANATVQALTVFDDGSGGGPALYVGGNFTSAGGVSANRIAKWDGELWSALGSGVSGGSVFALAVFDDGSGGGPALYAGGSFTSAGGVAASRIAKWDGESWSALGTGMNLTVGALTVFDDGSGPALYAGGNFTSAGGVSANRIARWDGESWSALGNGMGAHSVSALTVFDNGSGSGPALYAGGNFTTAGGVSANNIARWDGESWSALGTGMSSTVWALTEFDDGSGFGPALYAGGSFTAVGCHPANHIARWGCTEFGPKPGDINGDGCVGVADLLLLLGAWGQCPDCDDCPADLDGDCNVGVADLLILLANWG